MMKSFLIKFLALILLAKLMIATKKETKEIESINDNQIETRSQKDTTLNPINDENEYEAQTTDIIERDTKENCVCPSPEEAAKFGEVSNHLSQLEASVDNFRQQIDALNLSIQKKMEKAIDVNDCETSASSLQLYENCDNATKNDLYKFELKNYKGHSFNAQCMHTYNITSLFQDTACWDEKTIKDFGGGWMIVMRRQNGYVDFNKKWEDYKNGFGNLQGEFFIGLEKLHHLTHNEMHELLIIVSGVNDKHIEHVKYDSFSIENEKYGYRISQLGQYSGDASDIFSKNVDCRFTTTDRDNDKNTAGNCATTQKGGWWFSNCGDCNLCGEYGKHLKWRNKIINIAEMMIRPVRESSASIKVDRLFNFNEAENEL